MAIGQFWVILPLVDPSWHPLTPHDLKLTPAMQTLWVWVLPTDSVALWHSWAIWPLVDPNWPLHDLWPHHYIALNFDQGFFLSNSVAIGHSWAVWPLPAWPLCDLNPSNALRFREILARNYAPGPAWIIWSNIISPTCSRSMFWMQLLLELDGLIYALCIQIHLN